MRSRSIALGAPLLVHRFSQHDVSSSSSGMAPRMLGVVGQAIGDHDIPMRLWLGWVMSIRPRIVRDPASPGELGSGDIMVAPLTDPAWIPLFMAVDGVVVNMGGQKGQAIILSRELGLPCVGSVENATERIPDGALIEVNRTSGTVTLLE